MQSTLSLSFPLILASNSPRRREILGQAGFAFSVVASDIDESFPADMPLDEVPVFLSEKKARVLADINPHAIILAADTVVILDDIIFYARRHLAVPVLAFLSLHRQTMLLNEDLHLVTGTFSL